MRCFRRGYGDSYVAESFYDAESIRGRVDEGRLVSLVAVTPAEEIVGHMGLSLRRPGDTTGRPKSDRLHRTRPAMRLLACLVILPSLGCASLDLRPTGDAMTPTKRLEAALAALPGQADPDEAARLAHASYATTSALVSHYRPLRPPQLGNLAFHLGLRDRALCCHWVEDLLRALTALELESFELHWGVAHHGSQLREHSAVIAVPTGGTLQQGLVLDAWRHSGRLHWVRADRDRYPWSLHPSDALRHRLACSDDTP